MIRVALSKRTRFEIFKRDGFRCVYCGSSPPAVLLEADHVIPVVDGGTNDQDNLVTACEGCNRGKGPVSLQVIPRSLADQATEVAEREAQIAAHQAILRERRERIEDEQWEIVQALEGPSRDKYRRDYLVSIKTFLERLGFDSVLDAAEIARSKYPWGGRRLFLYFCGICWRRVRGE